MVPPGEWVENQHRKITNKTITGEVTLEKISPTSLKIHEGLTKNTYPKDKERKKLVKKDSDFIDYKNPGLNEQGGKNLKFIAEKSEFLKLTSDDEEKGILRNVDIFRLAVAVAVARDLKLPKKVRPIGSDPVERPNGKSWAQASLDMPSGKR